MVPLERCANLRLKDQIFEPLEVSYTKPAQPHLRNGDSAYRVTDSVPPDVDVSDNRLEAYRIGKNCFEPVLHG